jgi:hypothetical protein
MTQEFQTVSVRLRLKDVKKLKKVASEKYRGNFAELFREIVKPLLNN